MKKLTIILFIFIWFGNFSIAQIDNQADLLNDISGDEAQKFLPEKMIFTQNLLWGQKGLMNNTLYTVLI